MNQTPIQAENLRNFVLANDETEIENNLDEIGDTIGLIGRSASIKSVVRDICKIAPSDVAVLIIGESGTGKDISAKAIHQLSHRRNRPLVIVNSGAIAEGILESELFGHERGAFTGAVSERKGYFETANGGTVFLDEIGDMPLVTQVKLLRVLESGEFIKVGGSVVKKSDVRVIAATNRNLEQMVRRGEFRKDLYYRLKAITLNIAPLRARREDIPILVEKFIRSFSLQTHGSFKGFSPEAMDMITQYRWPGNVRELKNFVESLITLKRGDIVTPSDVTNNLQNFRDIDALNEDEPDNTRLPVAMHVTPEQAERELLYRTLLSLKQDITDIKHFLAAKFGGSASGLSSHASSPMIFDKKISESKVVEPEIYNVDESPERETMDVGEAEKELIIKALKRYDSKRSAAAKALGLSERTLYRKIKEYNLDL
ncbi:sigma-54-dependent Fis family transcriptional regulator [bacterium]|nr:MAG: sigma-54-dependent Fis family transcriptional regulator [bacterium]